MLWGGGGRTGGVETGGGGMGEDGGMRWGWTGDGVGAERVGRW